MCCAYKYTRHPLRVRFSSFGFISNFDLRLSDFVLRTVCWLATTTLLHAQSQWQGRVVTDPLATHHSSLVTENWLVLDSGGTGGGFGKGEPRGALQDVSFINERTGAAIGYSGALRTDDGGLTWRKLPLGPVVSADGRTQGKNWYCVRMLSTNEIWALGHIHPGGKHQTRLTRSLDGGETWSDLLVGKVGRADRLHCPNPLDRWVLGGTDGSYHSANGGATWRLINWGAQAWIRDIVFPGDESPGLVGYAVGVLRAKPEAGCVLKTEDGGVKWLPLALPATATNALTSACFINSREGWVGGRDGLVLHTADGGTTWDARSVPVRQHISSLAMFASGRGWAGVRLGFEGGKFIHDWTLFSTRDGGRSWQPVLGGQKNITALAALGPDKVWAVGQVPGFITNDLVAILRQ